MLPDATGKAVPLQITEDEAAVYDRQIRLWGMEAQQRMRNATILVVNLKGTATETIKNIVLAGIGKLIIMDEENVSEEDLGAGFFFQDSDVGSKRVEAARSRIESLNPLVAIETIPSLTPLDPDRIGETLKTVDLVCITDSSRESVVRINDACRLAGKPLYAGGSFGLIGYIFCDLIDHEYINPEKLDSKDPQKRNRASVSYCPLSTALKPYSWRSMGRAQTKDLKPAVVFTLLAIWEYQARHGGALPDASSCAPELEAIATELFNAAEINKRVLTSMPKDIVENLATTAAHEFSPVCAVLGGMLAQDMLKALAARDAPIANFFCFDGYTGHGSVCRMNM